MNCQRCENENVACVSAKCSDLFFIRLHEKEYYGYVPHGVGLGGGDYVEFRICMDCGQIQGNFPIAKTNIKKIRWEK